MNSISISINSIGTCNSINHIGMLYFPTETGWKTSAGVDSATAVKDMQLLSWNQNPENEEFVIQFGIVNYFFYSKKVIAIDSNGNQAWRITNPPTSGDFPHIIPISERRFFLFSGLNLTCETADSVVHFQQIPSIGNYVAKRLLGSYFIRWAEFENIQIFKFDDEGIATLHYSAKYNQDTISPNTVNIFQNSSDSGFAIIYTTANQGVWMKTMSRELRQLTPLTKIGGSTALTATPRAVFKGDSLYVVWIDHRNGVADVYGTVVVPHTALGVSQEGITEGAGIRITPNPARQQAKVELLGDGVRRQERAIFLWDMTGRELRRGVIGAGQQGGQIDLAGIAAGTYMLTVAGEGRAELLFVTE